ALTPEQLAARESALEALRARVNGARVDFDERFGTPQFVRSTEAFLTPPVAGDFDSAKTVRAFVEEYGAMFEASPDEIVLARRTRDFRTQHNGVRHLTWKQQIDGIELWGCELRANLTKHGELVNVSSTLLPRPENDFQPSPVRIDDESALRLAAQSIG